MKSTEEVLNQHGLKGYTTPAIKEKFIEAMKEYAREAIQEDRKNLLSHVDTKVIDYGIGTDIVIDEMSILNAPNIELL